MIQDVANNKTVKLNSSFQKKGNLFVCFVSVFFFLPVFYHIFDLKRQKN